MKYLLILLTTFTIRSFGQQQHYNDLVGFFEDKLTSTYLPIKYSVKGIKSITYYSCNDTIYNEENCSKNRSVHFTADTNLVFDTLFVGQSYKSRKIETTSEFIKTTETSFDAHQRKLKSDTDSLVLSKSKKPIERYHNSKLKTKWIYDSASRIIGRIDHINSPDQLETTNIAYYSNSIVEFTTTKEYAGIWRHQYELLFDKKSKRVLRENIYNEKVKFLDENRTVKEDRIIYHEPRELSRYVTYKYKANTIEKGWFNTDSVHWLIEINKFDKRKRMIFQCGLNEHGDTLSYSQYKYSKNKVVQTDYQENKFFERTIKYLNDTGRVKEKYETSANPQIWKRTFYDENGITIKEIDINHSYKSMRISVLKR